MFSLTWWIIASWYGFVLILLISFNIYLKRKSGEGLFGTFNFDIPRNLIWVSVLGIIGSVIVVFYPIAFLIYPDTINLTFPIPFLRSVPFEVIGIFLILAGGTIATVAMFQLGLSAYFLLPKQKAKLITSGAYALCRNPILVGAYLSLLGIFLLLPSLIYIGGFRFFLLNNHFRILQGEKFLTESFGAEYKNYQQKVGRYLPRISMMDEAQAVVRNAFITVRKRD